MRLDQLEGNPDGRVAWGSDIAAQMLRRFGIRYISLNPGASYRGFHDSLVNHLGNKDPGIILCMHEDHSVSIAHGYAKATGEPMACVLHSNVGLLHGMMGCSMPGATGRRSLCSARPGRWLPKSVGPGSTGSIRRAIKAPISARS